MPAIYHRVNFFDLVGVGSCALFFFNTLRLFVSFFVEYGICLNFTEVVCFVVPRESPAFCTEIGFVLTNVEFQIF